MTEARARREARASAALGPLDGVPVAWKDLIDVEGVPTTAGSALRRDVPPARADAPVVSRLAGAGMVCVGKTNLSELAYSGLGLNPHFGTPPNPRGTGPARIPGGSSAGSAVAVAAGAVACAIGTDTSGSIRVPAAFCGLVGFKADRRACRPHRDPAARADARQRRAADGERRATPSCSTRCCASRRRRTTSAPAATPGPRPAAARRVPDGELAGDVEPAVADAFAAALAALSHAGAAIERRPLAALAA